jgi:hypothetical protein
VEAEGSTLLVALARSAALAHRLGMVAQGGEVLARLVDELGPHLAARAALANELAPLLAQVRAAQERGDPIGIADRLEFELAPALTGTR